MAKTLVITLPDELEQLLSLRSAQLNKQPEDLILQVLTDQLPRSLEPATEDTNKTDPLLNLIGSISIDIPDLAENHDYYIGQSLQQELNRAG